jgi:hypothetical protein
MSTPGLIAGKKGIRTQVMRRTLLAHAFQVSDILVIFILI